MHRCYHNIIIIYVDDIYFRMLSNSLTILFKFQVHLLESLKVAHVIMSMKMILFKHENQCGINMVSNKIGDRNDILKLEKNGKWYMVEIIFLQILQQHNWAKASIVTWKGIQKSTNNVLEFFSRLKGYLITYTTMSWNPIMRWANVSLFWKWKCFLLKNSRDVYTSKTLNLFQEEYKKSLDIVVNACCDISPLFEYKVCM